MIVVYEADGDLIVVEEKEDESFRKKIMDMIYVDYTRKVYNSPVVIKHDMCVKEF